LLTLEPAALGSKIIEVVRETLEFELVGILMINKEGTTTGTKISPLTFAVSERVASIQKEHNQTFDCIINNYTQNEFLNSIFSNKTVRHTDNLKDIWADCIPDEPLQALTGEAHIKTISAYPLVINNIIVGLVVIAHNRTFDSLSQFENESIASFVDVIAVALNKAFLYKEVQEANAHLKEIDKLKSEFVSLATHQIRAPLTAIKGYLSEIFEGDFGPYPKELADPLNTIMRSNENLINIVGDFLNISRIEQGRMVYEFSTFDLGKITEEVGGEIKPNVDRAKLQLTMDITPGHNYMISADIGKTKQIIGNLIDNAIKYTKTGWIKATVSTVANTGAVRVAISDSGVGITPETMPKLFQKFSRATDANKTNVIGTGLGLYVVKTMVEAQHGKVWAESQGAGKGSTFIVEFPAVHGS
jgi:signal transduction histidine kinase